MTPPRITYAEADTEPMSPAIQYLRLILRYSDDVAGELKGDRQARQLTETIKDAAQALLRRVAKS